LFLRAAAAVFSGRAYAKAIDNFLVQVFYPEFPSFESPTKCCSNGQIFRHISRNDACLFQLVDIQVDVRSERVGASPLNGFKQNIIAVHRPSMARARTLPLNLCRALKGISYGHVAFAA
jgi:hypothetical protein